MKYVNQSWDPDATQEEPSFRSLISSDPALTYVLETGTFRKNGKFLEEETYKSDAFLKFISPYFEPAYTNAVKECFRRRDLQQMSDVAANPMLLTKAFKAIAVYNVSQFLEKILFELTNINDDLQEDVYIDLFILEDRTDITIISLLNYLPDEFQLIRTRFLIEIFRTVQEVIPNDFSMAVDIITNLRQLKADQQGMAKVDEQYIHLTKSTEEINRWHSGDKKDRSNTPTWVIVVIMLFILKLLHLLVKL